MKALVSVYAALEMATNCHVAKVVASEAIVMRDAIEMRYGDEKTTPRLRRRPFDSGRAWGAAVATARALPPEEHDQDGAQNEQDPHDQQQALGAQTLRPRQHLRQESCDRGARDTAGADEPEDSLGLPRRQEVVGDRPDLHGREDPQDADPDVERGVLPLQLRVIPHQPEEAAPARRRRAAGTRREGHAARPCGRSSGRRRSPRPPGGQWPRWRRAASRP